MSKFELLKKTLLEYYRSNESALQIFVEIVKNRSTVVSLRLLDWFVTNYVKSNEIPDESIEERLNRQHLFFIYTQNLNSYKKVWFDPFARESPDKGSFKIYFNTDTCEFLSTLPTNNTTTESVSSESSNSNETHSSMDGASNEDADNNNDSDSIISTTIGQLNFFRCAIEYGMITYVFQHHERIQNHMLLGLSARKKTKADEQRNIYRPLEHVHSTNNVYKVTQTFSNDPTVHFAIHQRKK